MTMIFEDGHKFIGEVSLETKDPDTHRLDNVEPVSVRAYENGHMQYIAIRARGQRIYMDERQVSDLIHWLERNGVILGAG